MALGAEAKDSNAGLRENNLLSLSYGAIVRKDIERVHGLLPESFETYQVVRRNDIVMRMTDLQNDQRSLRTARATEKGIITSAYVTFRPRGVDANFLAHLLRAYDHTKVFYAMGGGMRQTLRYEELRRLPILVPPPSEQRQIADFLDRETAKIDALIEKQTALIATLRERRTGLSWTITLGQTSSATAGAWFGDPPSGWHTERLNRHTRVANGSTPDRARVDYWDGAVPWLNSSFANQDVVRAADQFVTPTALSECHLPWLQPGCVLVAITGQGRTRGMATLLGMEATINQHLAAVVPDPRHWDPRYLTQLMRAAYTELRVISDEAGSTRGALTCEDLKRFVVPRPPLEEQGELADLLDRKTAEIDLLISKAERFIALARERRAALITAAVTGQLDVTTGKAAA